MAKGIKLRDWTLWDTDYPDDSALRAAVQDELAAFEHIGERLGIGIVAVPLRERFEDGKGSVHVKTRGWQFRTCTVPLLGQAQPAPEPVDVEGEGEPEELGEYHDLMTEDEPAES